MAVSTQQYTEFIGDKPFQDLTEDQKVEFERVIRSGIMVNAMRSLENHKLQQIAALIHIDMTDPRAVAGAARMQGVIHGLSMVPEILVEMVQPRNEVMEGISE